MANEGKTNLEQDPKALMEQIFDITHRMYMELGQPDQDAPEDSRARIFHLFNQLGKVLVHADRCLFWKWDKPKRKLFTTAAVGTDTITMEEGSGMVGKALRESCVLATNDPYHHPDFNPNVDEQTGYLTKSILVMPVKNCKGELIGAFQAINKLEDVGFDPEQDCHRLSLAAFICGITLESDLFMDDSQHDKLTDLKNRMGFSSDYISKYARLLEDQEKETAVSLLICDIDFFKKVNDTYGHNAGDAVLAHVAKILSGSIRGSDQVYRWGGGEFLVLLAGAPLDRAVEVADRIRCKVEASYCTFEGQDIRITMSFGCTQLQAGLSSEENIKIADARLHRAKESGRNRVVGYDDL